MNNFVASFMAGSVGSAATNAFEAVTVAK